MNKMKRICSFLLVFIASFLCVCNRAWSANILYMSTTASPSHNIWDKTLAIALRDRGHHITYVSPHVSDSPKDSMDNFTTIALEGVHKILMSNFNLENTVNTTTIETIHLLFAWINSSCHFGIKTQGFKNVLKLAESQTKFDLIIFDILTGICFYPIVELFGYPPLLGTIPFGISPYITDNFGIDLHTSYMPYHSVSYTQHMSFMERLYNSFFQMYEMSLKYYYWGKIKAMLDEFYGRDVRFIYDVEKNFSILLPNYDPILDYPRPLPPDVIPVGGLHTKRAKSLPRDLQIYLDNSNEGVIMFSLGTNVRSDKLKIEKRKVILDAFAQLKQNIIWKFESDISNLPKNVIVRKFLPQNDILAHPNIKLLINHGGALSTQEAMYHGVPLIIIPFYLDQRTNSHKIINRKIGLTLNYENLTVDNILSTIREVANNPIYTKNAKKISQIIQDRPEHPLDRAVFWVEHVLRQDGTEYLRIPARKMPFYQIHLLDIWAFLLAVLIISFIIIKKICNKLLGIYTPKKEIKLKSN